MIDKRPVNLDISSIHLPITAYTSILHRVTGMALLLAVAWFLYLLDLSLRSPEGFAQVIAYLQITSVKCGVFVALAALNYHLVAGIKHLLMDIGIGESLEGGVNAARMTLCAFLVLTGVTAVWLW